MSQGYQCQECKGTQAIPQMREVMITVGWEHTVVKVVAPCLMCARCGKLGVVTTTQIGRFMNLVPGDGGGDDGGTKMPVRGAAGGQEGARDSSSTEPAAAPEACPAAGAKALRIAPG